jgi:hypothetical protein
MLQASGLQAVMFPFVGKANQGKDIVFRSIIEYIEYSSLRDFGPY